MNKKSPEIAEPIDFQKLARCYELCRWKLWNPEDNTSGYPSADQIEQNIIRRKAELQTRPGPDQVSESGGIALRWRDGKIIVFIDEKLAAYYCAKADDVAEEKYPCMQQTKLSDTDKTEAQLLVERMKERGLIGLKKE